MNFCPTPGQYNKGILKKCLESFNKKIKLKAFFHNKSKQKQMFQTNAQLTWIKISNWLKM